MTSSGDKTPRAYRPLYTEYITVGYILRNEPVYDMTEEQFVGCCVFYSGYGMNPTLAKAIYRNLMEEAGI